MEKYFEKLGKALLNHSCQELGSAEQKVIDSIAQHTTVAAYEIN